MLIINADDWGRSCAETNAALMCCRQGRVTSVSAMVWMEDSERAARIARAYQIDVGLHLNFSERFTDDRTPTRLLECQERISRYLTQNRFSQLIYNPLLRSDFAYSYRAQIDEFQRLYGARPSHLDGHHHMHLCANVLFSDLVPRGTKMRRNFSFWPGEKSLPNRAYRQLVDRWLARKYRLPDYFFCLPPCLRGQRLKRAASLAQTANVELMTHPIVKDELDFLLSDDFCRAFQASKLASYAQL